jgi:cytochrome b6-f complex iron-sulfur subunit
MKRAEGLEVIVTRRHFCGGVATCLGAAFVASCADGDGTSVVQTTGLNGPDGEQNMGSGSGSGSGSGMHLDAGVTTDAGGTTATCPATGATDVGAASTFTANVPKYFSSGNFFVVRDSGGLYALTARCTHDGVTISAESSDFYCPAHGATFTFDGTVTQGPAFNPLVHYAMCTLSNGHVGVVKSQTVSQSQRLVA